MTRPTQTFMDQHTQAIIHWQFAPQERRQFLEFGPLARLS